MFNEMDLEALTEAMGLLEAKLQATDEITVEDLATALDHAGITGLFHDGTRAARRCAGNDPFARIR